MTMKTAYDHGAFCWVDLMAHDVAGAKEFYGGLFGWRAEDQHDPDGNVIYVIFKHPSGGDAAGLGQMMDEMKSQGVPPIWSSYINVDDVEAAAEQAVQLGGSVVMGPMQVMQAGKMAVIADPAGANVSLWQKGEHFGAGVVGEPGAFCWNELATRDIEKAKDFYGKLLGWEFQRHEESPAEYFIILNRGNMNGGIMQMTAEWGEMPPHWMVYFTVADADAAVERIKQLGGGACVEPFDISVGRIAVVNDPQGGTFSVIKMNPPPA